MGNLIKWLLVGWRGYALAGGIAFASGAGLAGWLAWELHKGSVATLELKHEKALESQKDTLNAECNKDKQIAMEVSNETQEALARVRKQLDAVKRVQPNRCVPTPARPAGGADAAEADAKLRQQNGVYSDTLYDFAGEVEQEAGTPLDKLQQFVCRVWKDRGQPLPYAVCKK